MKTKNANDVLSPWRINATIYLTTVLYLAALACLAPLRTSAQSVGEKVSAAASETKEKIQDAGKTAANKLEQLWQRIDEQRLKNRTPDEMVAWLIMGLLVGSILGRATGLRSWTAFAFGLIGAFLGGILVHLTQFNLGLGPVLIRYEDLLFSLAGGVLLLLVARRFMSQKPKKN
jgi:uncharacterized membrane protein YeaQ/YmgE (transglycosylase-associated protein family)